MAARRDANALDHDGRGHVARRRHQDGDLSDGDVPSGDEGNYADPGVSGGVDGRRSSHHTARRPERRRAHDDREVVPALTLFTAATMHPQTIGRYRIIGTLGEGGMGTVYEAVQDQPNR